MSNNTTSGFENTMSLPCARLEDLGCYLLGGMNATEAQELRVHIDTCAHCGPELRSLRPVVDLLATSDLDVLGSSDRVEPDPTLASRLFARAEKEIGGDPFVGAGATAPTGPVSTNPAPTNPVSTGPAPTDPVRTGSAAPDSASGNVIAFPTNARSRRRRVGVAAAVAFALGVGSTVGVQQVAQRLNKPAKSKTGEHITFVTQKTTTTSEQQPKAWAWIDQTGAGTYAYLYTRDLKPDVVYRWWFEQANGKRIPLGSFTFPKNQKDWLICPGSTSILRSEIVAIGATNGDGVDVLRTDLPKAPQLA
jgi:hypothetical protein